MLPSTAIVLSSSFHYDAETNCFSARKSNLGENFAFASLDRPESDIGFGLQLGFGLTGIVFVFYLTRTLEAEGKVTGWEFRILPQSVNWLSDGMTEMSAQISND